MKSFQDFISEDAPGATTGSGSTVSKSGGSEPFNINDPVVLKRVNAFVGSIGDREYLVPENAVHQLKGFLERIGLTFPKGLELPESGGVTVPLQRHGGTFGKSIDTPFDEFDREDENTGKSIKIDVEELKNNSWKVYAKIV
jgi:hypothetical protein